jgi:hypothetical protein
VYRVGHRCETALLSAMNDILCIADRGDLTFLFLLKFSAVFDVIDHEILLSRLYSIWGGHCRDCPLLVHIQWSLKYAFTNRCTKVYLDFKPKNLSNKTLLSFDHRVSRHYYNSWRPVSTFDLHLYVNIKTTVVQTQIMLCISMKWGAIETTLSDYPNQEFHFCVHFDFHYYTIRNVTVI